MNLLQFLEMNVVETLLLSIASLAVVFASSSIGALFIKEKNCLCLRATLGLSFVAVLTLLAASYCAVLAKYVIYISIGISFILLLRELLNKSLSIRSCFKSLLPVLIIFGCFIGLLMLYIFTRGSTIDYNCHMIYCSAIPEELYKADYFSRLRIADVYPYEWSKYHMFNGCISAIPLAVFPFKNIVTFNIAKYAVVALLIGAIYERLVYAKAGGVKHATQLSIFILFLFVVCANRFTIWTLFINNYSSFLVMGILWLVMREERYSSAAMLSMILAVATSKSTITGFLFFLFAFYMLHKSYNGSMRKMLISERLTTLYCLAFGLGCFAMVTAGASPANEQLFNADFIANANHPSWISLFFFGDSFNAFVQTKDISTLGWSILLPLLYLVIILTQRSKIIDFSKRHLRSMAYATLLLMSLYMMYWMQSHNGSLTISMSFFVIPLRLVLLYLLPIVCVFSCCEKHMYTPLQLFVVFSFVQLMLFNADNGACNYCLLMFPLALYAAEVIVAFFTRISSRLSSTLFLILFCGTLFYGLTNDVCRIFVWSQDDWFHNELELSSADNVEYLGEVPYEYTTPDDAENVMLNSLKGNRIHYNVGLDLSDSVISQLSMSLRFIPSIEH